MYTNQLPIPRAFFALLDVTRGYLSPEKAMTFALTWLAAARMVNAGTVIGVSSIGDLANLESWQMLKAQGLPIDDSGVGLKDGKLEVVNLSQLLAAVTVVRTLSEEIGSGSWDVLPSLAAARTRGGGADWEVAEPVAELMLDLFPRENPQTIWIPFDSWGALTLRALRRNKRVCAAPMVASSTNELKLMLAIETGRPDHESVDTSIERDSQGRPLTQVEHALVVPPFGVAVRNSRLAQWITPQSGSSDYDRSETMVVAEILTRVSGTAVFLVPQGLLFTGGQEQRLRKAIVHRGGEFCNLRTVVALPPGAFTSTHISTAVVAVGQSTSELVMMADLGASKRSSAELAELVSANKESIVCALPDAPRSAQVSRQQIIDKDFTFAPSRYIYQPIELGANAIALGELCEVIRPPVPSKDEFDTEVLEVGIPELGQWQPLSGPFTKKTRVRTTGKKVNFLQENDILLSVKGTVGRAGVVGGGQSHPLIPSQSCIGLRLIPNKLGLPSWSSQYLLMFLRSDAGQRQLESLKVGATVQHLNIATLLEQYLVPVEAPSKQSSVTDTYARICDFETDLKVAQRGIEALAKEHWGSI